MFWESSFLKQVNWGAPEAWYGCVSNVGTCGTTLERMDHRIEVMRETPEKKNMNHEGWETPPNEPELPKYRT